MTGMNRGRIKWDIIKKLVVLEYKQEDPEISALFKEMEQFWENPKIFLQRKNRHISMLETDLEVSGEDAHKLVSF